MPRTRIQAGGINTDISASGKKIWVFRWRETRPDGRRAPRKRVIGTLEEFPTRQSADDAARPFRSNLTDNDSAVITDMTMGELVEHFREHELMNRGDGGRAYSTRNRYQSVLDAWVSPRWKNIPIAKIRTVAVGTMASLDPASEWYKVQDSKHYERFVQPRDPMGVYAE